MTINAGKLVWSKSWPTGAWCTESFADENSAYVIERWRHGGYKVKISRRCEDQTNRPPVGFLMENVDIGWGINLVDAKAIADRHHHAAILAGDDENLKSYVHRYCLSTREH